MELKTFLQFKKGGQTSAFDGGMFPPRNPQSLPRRIFMFWDKGFNAAPELVRFCIGSWRFLNPTWELVILDEESARDYLDRNTFPPGIISAHYADALRTHLLQKEGGVWVDASVLCLKPLDEWLPSIFNQSDFFAFYRPGPDRVISTWFLASIPDSTISKLWRSASANFWSMEFPGGRPYYWLHYVFEYLLRTNDDFRSSFEVMPKHSAEPPHILQSILSAGKLSQSEIFRARFTELQKLNYKSGVPFSDLMLVLRRLELQTVESLLKRG